MDQTSDLIGSSPRRKEDRRLLVGAGRYLDDMTREGLLHLGVVRSPHGHARIRAIDTRDALDPARRRRGVERRRSARGGAAHPGRRRGRAQGPALRGARPRGRRRPLRGRVRGGGGGRRSLSPGRCDRARRRRLRAAARPHHGGGGAGLRDAPARGLARQCRGGRPREHRRCRAGARLSRRGRERALPPRAPRRGVHRDARRAGLSRSGLGPARPLVVHAEPVLDPGRRRAHRRRARRGGPRARARRRRRLRPQGRAVPGRGAGRPRGASPGTPGEVGREPARGFPGERPRPRAEPSGEDRLPQGRRHRRHRRELPRGCGRLSRAGQWPDAQYREPPARAVPGGALSQCRHERRHQQDAQHGLSRRRPPRGRLRDGAPHGHRRAPPRPRPRGDPPPEPGAAIRDAVSPGPHLQGRRGDRL